MNIQILINILYFSKRKIKTTIKNFILYYKTLLKHKNRCVPGSQIPEKRFQNTKKSKAA